MKNIFICFVFCIFFMGCSEKTKGETEAFSDAQQIETIEVIDLAESVSEDGKVVKKELDPILNKNDQKFRIAIVQSGEYSGYSHMLKGIIEGLATLGWLKEDTKVDDTLLMKDIISALADTTSDYLTFSLDAYYDFDWEEPEVIPNSLRRIINGEKADLIISLGTTACLVIAQSSHLKIPMIAENVSDPVNAGLVTSLTNSGNDLLTASCDPEMDLRQFRLFHSVIKFKKLGIIYTDTPLGRSYGAVDAAEVISKELGFELVRNTNVIEDPTDADFDLAERKYIQAVANLAPKIDALYLGIQGGLTPDIIPKILPIINKYKIPTFAMEGSDFVSNGILLGESESNVISVGIYNAKKIVKTLKGEKPRSLDQIFEHVPHIAINLKAAELIGYDVPIDIIASSDEIYQTIGGDQ